MWCKSGARWPLKFLKFSWWAGLVMAGIFFKTPALHSLYTNIQ